MENNDDADDSHLNTVPKIHADIDQDYKMALKEECIDQKYCHS